MFRDQQKSRQRFACFSSHGSMAVCDIHSVWAVLLVILNKVEVCPLFAALRVFCHTQHIQGRPQLRLQKSYQFQALKTNPKEASFPCLSS